MAEKPETRFSRLFHRNLSRKYPGIYVEKTNNPFRAGVPDFYYEGKSGRIVWAEHKWIKEPWTKNREPSKVCGSKSWTSQRHWLERAHKNGNRSYVIVGVGKGLKTKAHVLRYPYDFNAADKVYSLDELVELFGDILWGTVQSTK